MLMVMLEGGGLISTFPGREGEILYVTAELEVAQDAFNRRILGLYVRLT